MKIFVVNCGSSSIKFQLFDMADESVIAKGLLERIGSDEAALELFVRGGDGGEKTVGMDGGQDHSAALATIIDSLVSRGAIEDVAAIDGVGHRVVHGGEAMTESCAIDEEVLGVIRDNCQLAPLHNPPNLAGIEGAMAAMPDATHVAVFDTAFLATLPAKAHRYAVPHAWYTEHHVRKYGFHGTSHRYVTFRTAELLNKPADRINLITTHLGNGCSMTAVAGGRAIDHSMGMTPLEGLMMGTRSGDLDPAVVFYMASQGMELDQIDRALNKESGLLGVSGLSNDMRDLLEAVDQGNRRAELAVELFVHRLLKYIGSYYVILPDLDAIVLTGGIGENSIPVRKRLCEGLRRLGVTFDSARNEKTIRGRTGPISGDDSNLPVLVVPTNEELMIARDAEAVVR